MHTKIITIMTLSVTLALFAGCTGVTHGFDDESALYSGPTLEQESKNESTSPMTKETKTEREENKTTVEYNRYEGE